MAESTRIDRELWTERYRPQTLDDILLPARIKKRFENGLDTNILLVGSAGIGKTTLARILAKDFTAKLINASLDNGIESVRNQICNFASTAGLKNHYKVIILDECDNLSLQAQSSLRGAVEQFHKVARFIFTCNYPEKLLDPIKSRFEIIDLNFTEEEEIEQTKLCMKRIIEICKNENIHIDADSVRALIKLYFPDMRTIVKTLQALSRVTNNITVDLIQKQSLNSEDAELYKFIVEYSHPVDIYKYIKPKYANKERECYAALSTEFIDWMIANGKGDKIGQVSVIVSKYMYESEKAIDKLIPLLACVFELSRLFK